MERTRIRDEDVIATDVGWRPVLAGVPRPIVRFRRRLTGPGHR